MSVQFTYRWVNSRKNLIEFVQEFYEGDVLKEVGTNPNKWLDELIMIHNMTTGHSLSAGVGLHIPPTQDKDFKQIGENVFFYSGQKGKLRGLWLPKEVPDYSQSLEVRGTKIQWTHYKLGSRAQLRINEEYEGISIEDFLPENFEPRSEEVKTDRRPVLRLKLDNQGIEETIYVKGSQIIKSIYYPEAKPGYRLTSIYNIHKQSSQQDLDKIIQLAEQEVRVPDVVGVYESDYEDFLFLIEVKGESPDKNFPKHRDEIIRQDAMMLAKFCKLGYRKIDFESFDDKIFDGKDLYLIDFNEIIDLYSYTEPDFREVLIDTSGKELRKFRNFQKGIFTMLLKDAIYIYDDSLLINKDHKIKYIKHFFEEMKWTLTEKKTNSLLTFPKDYLTYGAYLCMMTEE